MWNAFENLLTIHENFLSIYYILKKKSSFDLNNFLRKMSKSFPVTNIFQS